MPQVIKPIVFLLGPSGAGKSQLATWIAEDLGFVWIEIDRFPKDGIELAGLRKEWDTFQESGQATEMASTICDRVKLAQKDGAILSFPSTLVLPICHIEAAERQGIRFLILYGTGAVCLEAFLRRERESGRGLDAEHWILNNAASYAEISRPEYSKYRLMAFDQSCH